MRRILPVLLSAVCLPASAFFVILDAKRECFLVEQPLDTQLTVRYALPQQEEKPGQEDPKVGVKITLVDRHTQSVVFSRLVNGHTGEEAMSTVSEAAHDLCVKPIGQEGSVRLDIAVERGHGDRYYAQMASEHHMDRLQVEVVKLNDELAEILNEADYMKEKEVRFHRKAERYNLAAIWWPILQIAILVLTAVFQVQNLKSYFQTKLFY